MIKAEVTQTKPDEISEGWEICSLGDVAYFSNGKSSPERNDSFNYEVFGSNGIIGRATQYNSTEGTVIVGRVGSYCGSVYFSKNKCWVTDNAIIGLPRENADARFLYYLLLNLDLNNHRSGSGQPLLNQGILNSIRVSIPPLKEQRAIIKILSDLDEKIELNHRMNKTLEAIAQAIFKRWFVDFNFPDDKGRPYKDFGGRMIDSDLGEIPQGWRAGRFSDFVSNVKDPLKPGEEISDRKYVPIESLPMKQIGMIDDKSYLEAQSSLIAFEKDDILFGAMRAYFHRVNFAPYKGVTRTTAFVLRPHKLFYLSYGLFLLNLESSVHYANLHSKGSTMPYAVWENSLSEMSTVVPDESALDIYHRIIYPLLQRISELSDENKILTRIRDALLPKLMSGKIRVNQ